MLLSQFSVLFSSQNVLNLVFKDAVRLYSARVSLAFPLNVDVCKLEK